MANTDEVNSTPKISVVITIGARRWRALRCLKALLAQEEAPRMQIIVMDSEPQLGLPDLPGIEHVPCRDCASIPHAKTQGVRQARADVIAFIEDHCVPAPGWAAAIYAAVEAHPEVSAFAYTFDNLNPVNWVSRSFFLLAYGPWIGPLPSGYIPTPSWMNVTYRKSTLLAAENLVHWFSCEGLFLHRLQQSGAKFWQTSEARVSHLNHPSAIDSGKDSAVWQRLTASVRVEVDQWNWPRRLLYFVAAVPLSPAVITWRLGKRLWSRPDLRWQFIAGLPLIYFVYSFGAFAEAAGYVAGPGDAARRTFEIETGDPRGEAP